MLPEAREVAVAAATAVIDEADARQLDGHEAGSGDLMRKGIAESREPGDLKS